MDKANKADDKQADNKRDLPQRRPNAVYVFWSLTGLTIVVAGLIIASRWLNTAISDRVQFVTGNLLNGLIFAAIVAQVLIYRKQRDIMRQQWQVMREQSAKTEEAFVLANRASLSVHSIELNKTRRVVLVKVENTGNMPAEDISLLLKLVTFGPVEDLESDNPKQEIKSSAVREFYGGTKLFKGNLPILLTFYFSKWTESEFINIEKGKLDLMLIGYIEYGDGFSEGANKRTEFCFNYHPEIDAWSAGPTEYGDMLGWGDKEAG